MMTPLRPVAGVLAKALIVSETLRPPIGMFDLVRMRAPAAIEFELPMQTMWSHCQNVSFPAAAAEGSGTWMTCEAYYQARRQCRRPRQPRSAPDLLR